MPAEHFLCLAMHDIEVVVSGRTLSRDQNVVAVWQLADVSAMSPVPNVEHRVGFGLGGTGFGRTH